MHRSKKNNSESRKKYTNSKNSLRADVVEINIETKDTKIFMYENNKKINIKSNK